jgi:hypothetical protein
LKKFVLPALISVLLSAVTVAAFEGGYSLYKWRNLHRSVIYQLSAEAGLVRPRSNKSAYAPYFSNPQELDDLLPLIVEQGVGLGGVHLGRTRFDVETSESAIRSVDNGCPTLKPNLRMTAFFLHASAFGPFGFPAVFHRVDKKLDPRLEDFFRRYGGPHTTLSTNDRGERVTVPDVSSDHVVLVVGDSVAFGAMIDDNVTIASQMQARDQTRRYVNMGIPGMTAAQIHCRLENAMQRYKGKIDEIIYVYCENDFQPDNPYGTPKEVVESLKDTAERDKIAKVTVVFSPYVYMVAPDLTRMDGAEWIPTRGHETERLQLKGLVESAGFRWADIGALARSEEQTSKSSLAILSYFVDDVHLSALGTEKLVDHLVNAD